MWVAGIKHYWQRRRLLPVVQIQSSAMQGGQKCALCTCSLEAAGEKETKPLAVWPGEYLSLSSGLVTAQPLLPDTELSRSSVTCPGCHWHRAGEGWAAWGQRFPLTASLCSLHCQAVRMGNPWGVSSSSGERGKARGNPKWTENSVLGEQNLLPRNASVAVKPGALHTGKASTAQFPCQQSIAAFSSPAGNEKSLW